MKNLSNLTLAIGIVAALTATAADARNTSFSLKNCANRANTFKIKDGKNSNLGYTKHLKSGQEISSLKCRGRGKGRCQLEVKKKGAAHYNKGPKVKRGKTAYYLGKNTWSNNGCG